jgi:hypothetical protein
VVKVMNGVGSCRGNGKRCPVVAVVVTNNAKRRWRRVSTIRAVYVEDTRMFEGKGARCSW